MQENEVGNGTKRAFEKAAGDKRFLYVWQRVGLAALTLSWDR
jgi:hypothetical protein